MCQWYALPRPELYLYWAVEETWDKKFAVFFEQRFPPVKYFNGDAIEPASGFSDALQPQTDVQVVSKFRLQQSRTWTRYRW